MAKISQEKMDVLMSLTPDEQAYFDAKDKEIEAMPDEGGEPISPRERLAYILPQSLIDTMDDEEVATQVLIMDDESEDILDQLPESISQDGSIAK